MGEVAVDRGHERCSRRECSLEAGGVGGAQAFLSLAVEDVQEANLAFEPVGQLARAVG